MNIDFSKMGTGDIESFADLLKFCIKENYDLKHAEGGFNPNSGNVWILSEYEQSATFCDMSGDCRFMFSCPECGTEYISDKKDVGDMLDFKKDLEDMQGDSFKKSKEKKFCCKTYFKDLSE